MNKHMHQLNQKWKAELNHYAELGRKREEERRQRIKELKLSLIGAKTLVAINALACVLLGIGATADFKASEKGTKTFCQVASAFFGVCAVCKEVCRRMDKRELEELQGRVRE